MQKQTIYLQIAEHLTEKILRKELNAEEKIPSIREMAINIEVNPNTIVRTYSYLEEKNIIRKERGIGYFVTKEAFKIIQKIKKQHFLSTELPYLFKTMDLLNLDFNEIQVIYNLHKQETTS